VKILGQKGKSEAIVRNSRQDKRLERENSRSKRKKRSHSEKFEAGQAYGE
jgi:hypothetical protein